MANRMIRVCDVCGDPADGDPVKFGWETGFYETDLCSEHGTALRDLMESAVKNARQLGAGKSNAPTPPVAGRRRVEQADVRAWAKKKRIKVNERGRLPEALIEQYLADTQ